MDLTYIATHLNTHEKCVKYLERKRWSATPTCTNCGSLRSSPKGLRHTCLDCSNSYSVTVGTIFENSNLPLNKWFVAIALILSAKKGISSLQISRDISVNKNTAWLLQMKIRRAMGEDNLQFLTRGNEHSTDDQLDKKPEDPQDVSKPAIDEKSHSIHLSGTRSFWSLFRRALIGQFHRIDDRYLSRYLDELNYKQRHKTSNDKGYSELMLRAFPRSFAKS